MKKFKVQFFVWSDIERVVKADNKDEALQKAIAEAVDDPETCKVTWLYDDMSEPLIEEVEE